MRMFTRTGTAPVLMYFMDSPFKMVYHDGFLNRVHAYL